MTTPPILADLPEIAAGWQPIETAPVGDKGGMLVCIMDDGDYDAIEWVSHWSDANHGWLNLNSGNYFTPSYGSMFTHWMPLPGRPND